MPSIQSIGQPLVYRVEERSLPLDPLPTSPDVIAVRVSARALEGMQKEAVVQDSSSSAIWRMVSDEGPYLNGTDLAPFPLAFYTAGMAFSFQEEVLRLAAALGVVIRSLTLTQNNFYTMEGSAIRGDMTGGAKPVTLEVSVDADASDDVIASIMRKAELTSPPQAYMRDVLDNTFALCLEGRELPTKRVSPSPRELHDNPEPIFDSARPGTDAPYQSDIITKLEAADSVFNVEGGAASSLQAEQKRTLHVRGIASLREDGPKEIRIQLLKPIGSVFHCLSDGPAADNGQERAPSGLAYLSAGIAFCFMTQLGRYAQIVKMPLESYAVVQDNVYRRDHRLAGCDPVDTHVFVRCQQPDEDAQQLVSMGEQTCFLHAAIRTPNPSEITVTVGERELAL